MIRSRKFFLFSYGLTVSAMCACACLNNAVTSHLSFDCSFERSSIYMRFWRCVDVWTAFSLLDLLEFLSTVWAYSTSHSYGKTSVESHTVFQQVATNKSKRIFVDFAAKSTTNQQIRTYAFNSLHPTGLRLYRKIENWNSCKCFMKNVNLSSGETRSQWHTPFSTHMLARPKFERKQKRVMNLFELNQQSGYRFLGSVFFCNCIVAGTEAEPTYT